MFAWLILLIIIGLIIAGFATDEEAFFGVGFFGLFVWVMLEGGFYIDGTSKYANYQVIDEKIVVLNERAQSVVDKLKFEADKYLSHEKGVFANLTPENVKILLVQYPQLKGNETIQKLMEEISRLNDDAYKLRLDKLDIKASLIWHKNNPLSVYNPTL
jgi:hypothetical protein